ncbi:hypothetical protein BIV23_03300 [Streptomyces monashensis]|uniref:Uncharacterized protein n=1 Tax=Streptomyces monashensis TaxID=1678012 RepID=A0A1S2QQ56_9ACTN|nr:hypothetical protein BIV23_03300 [Streptomyces monashensis]
MAGLAMRPAQGNGHGPVACHGFVLGGAARLIGRRMPIRFVPGTAPTAVPPSAATEGWRLGGAAHRCGAAPADGALSGHPGGTGATGAAGGPPGCDQDGRRRPATPWPFRAHVISVRSRHHDRMSGWTSR